MLSIVRSVDGNLPHILDRVSSHRKTLFSVLPAGFAKGHGASPSANIRANNTFAVPVLLSGIASLVLSSAELKIVNNHHKNTLQRLLKLHDKTPECVIHFLSGSLPATALIHLRQLSLFSMICRLPGTILNRIAYSVFSSHPDFYKSWFLQIRILCIKYNLPSPLSLLSYPPAKEESKKLFKLKIVDWWQTTFRSETQNL